MQREDVKARNTLRLIALSTTDNLIKKLAFDVLNETEQEVKSELSKTCYANDLDELREAIQAQYQTVVSSLGEKILSFMKERSMKVGHVIPMKPLQFQFIPTLTPVENDGLKQAFEELCEAGFIKEDLSLTDKGYARLYS